MWGRGTVFVLLSASIVFVSLPSKATAQTWETGDNSSISGCSSACSVDDPKALQCWQDSLAFFEKSLLVQMRHYVAVLVDVDQWYRRNYNKTGLNFADVLANATTHFRELYNELDKDGLRIVDLNSVLGITTTLVNRAANVSSKLLTRAPHFQCPTPCEYTHDITQKLFFTSMILNVLLLVSIIPVAWRTVRQWDKHEEKVRRRGLSLDYNRDIHRELR